MANDAQKAKAKHVIIPVLVIALTVLGLSFGIKYWEGKHAPAGSHAGPEVGTVLPDFGAPKVGNEKQSLRFSQLQSKIVMVNFWATWCEACIVEMPSIVRLRTDYKSKGFEVLGVSLDENSTLVPPMMKKLGMEFPVVIDSEGKLGDLFDVHAIPLTIIMDKSGKILMLQKGELDWNSAKFREKLEAWLAG